MNLSTILNTIKEKILHTLKNEITFIYIGVGTYAGLKNNNGILELANYHQYPPFLQDLKNRIPNLNLFIILIDPLQEQPPYMVADKDLQKEEEGNAYTSKDRKLFVYSLLQSVYTDPYECYGDSINITEELRDLNKFVIAHNSTLLYHDFTGRRNSLLAEYFDKEIGEHLSYSVYGMSARQDHGCYFDLTELGSYFPWTIQQGRINLFNIFYYIVNNKSITYSDEFSQEMKSMVNKQIEQVITTVKTDLVNHMLSLLRIVFRLSIGDEKSSEVNLEHSFNFISKLHRNEFLKLYNDSHYSLLFEKLIDYFSKDIDMAAKLKKYDLNGKEILQFITQGNKPYEWYNNIKYFF